MTTNRRKCPCYLETLISRAPIGYGFSWSTTKSLLQTSLERFHAREGIPEETVATSIRFSLARERSAAGQIAIAAVDCAAIAHGGVQLVKTKPPANANAQPYCVARPVPHNAAWIARHVVWAFLPRKRPHNSPLNLRGLYDDPRAPERVAAISGITDLAVSALETSNLKTLAEAVEAYREEFEAWKRQGRNSEMAQLVSALKRLMGSSLLAYKEPGAGGAPSVIAIVTEARAAVRWLTSAGWVARQAKVSGGLTFGSIPGKPGWARFMCPARLDLTAAADLGADPRIGAEGRCLAIAIEPRAELRFRNTWAR